jgi:hypothetical protein
MKFLIKRRGNNVRAHVWTGTDTLCRMASTSGLDVDRYDITSTLDDRAKNVCHMCRLLWGRLAKDEQHALHEMR